MRLSIFSLLLSFLGAVAALSASGNRLLVVLEDSTLKSLYSKFWADLESRGFELSFESPKSDKLDLFALGERAYDHILLLPPSGKAYGNALSPKLLLDFINSEGNILLGLSAESPTPTAIVSLLLELDIHLPPDRHSVIVDHFNYDAASAPEKHDVVIVEAPKPIRKDVKNFFGGKNPLAVPHAVGQVLGNASPLLAPILRAPNTAYCYNPKDDSESVEDLFASGQQLSLVSALQARNSARFTVLGSIEMIQDKWFDETVKLDGKSVSTGNRDFARKLSAWTFKELGILKVGKLEHHLNEDSTSVSANKGAVAELNPKIYRIKNDVTYTIELSEYHGDGFIPFQPPAGDAVQLEFTMLSPFHRLPLKAVGITANSTRFSTSFTLPDQHGIFSFRVNYKRPFLTSVYEKRDVSVRHFAHDEWPRSWLISGAWTWIAGIWVTIAGWVAFVAVWLWSAPPKGVSSKKTQ